MNLLEAQAIIDDVQYDDWAFDLVPESDDRLFLRVRFKADGGTQLGRKWLISKFVTKSELVQTCLKAVLTALEHEAREHFRYKGRGVFGPHIDVDHLVTLVDEENSLDIRKVANK